MWSEGSRPLRPVLPSLDHLRRLTDDTGLLEHALGRIPRRREGYTTDDNARALWTVTERYRLLSDTGAFRQECDTLLSLADIYLAFLLWSQREDGWWHNNVAYDRTWEDEERSHDCQGRAVWSCADAWARLPDTRGETAYVMLQKAMPTLGSIASLRGRAYAMAACAHLLDAAEQGAVALPEGWEGEFRHHLARLEEILAGAFYDFSEGDWHWFEPAVTYGNGIMPWAMLRAFRVTRSPETLRIGVVSLLFLQRVMTGEDGTFRPVGNAGWCTRERVSQWDQQPLEMFKLALAFEEAALALETAGTGRDGGVSEPAAVDSSAGLTRPAGAGGPLSGAAANLHDAAAGAIPEPAEFRRRRNRCLDWFYGANDHRAMMANPLDGSCCDGLQAEGPNLNCGAEATLSYLMTATLCAKGGAD
jgi:hypothetical protein